MTTIEVRELAADLVDHLQAGARISAIKTVRSMTGCGLLEAKEIVEAFAKAYGKPAPLAPLYPKNEEFVVVVHDDYETYSNTFNCEASAMEYADGRGETTVQVARVIAKTVSVTTHTLKRI